ncbi:MAG TPA: RES domain-containing protein, partial [Candidatus Dormibacteraeota bacterium]|nr:RES domain-containing protein [Candidatus Dormibacteraeota bacterium]
MQSLTPPPTTLPPLQPEEVVELHGSPLFRIYPSAGAHPLPWDGPRVSPAALARLDPHAAGPVGVWYAARELATALAETFQETRTVQARPDRPRLCLARVA